MAENLTIGQRLLLAVTSLRNAVAGLQPQRHYPQHIRTQYQRITAVIAADAVIPAGARVFLEPDPNRFSIILSMDRLSDDCYIIPIAPETSGAGIAICMGLTYLPYVHLEFAKHGSVVCAGWEIAANNVNPAFVHCITTSYISERGE